MKFAMATALVAALLLITTHGANADPAAELPPDDSLTGEKCLWEFNRRYVGLRCWSPSAERASDTTCRIRARCAHDLPSLDSSWTEVTVKYERISALRNCDGTLKEGPC